MTKHKKLSLSNICKNILMVCGVITALTGAAGGVMETFGIGKSGKSEGGDAGAAVIEQRISVPAGGHVRVSKTVDIGGDAGAAGATEGDVPDSVPVADEAPVTMMMAPPESSLTERLGGLWGWLLGAGLVVIGGIMGLGWWVNRTVKEKIHENTGS